MGSIKKIVTPLCSGRTVPSITAKERIYPTHMLDTGHYPASGVMEVWKKPERRIILNLSSGICGTVKSNYYKMGIRNFILVKDNDGGTFKAECILCVKNRC